MAAILTLKYLAMMLTTLFSGCSSPDSFELGYGYGWGRGQSAVHEFRANDTYDFENSVNEQVWGAFTWNLGPIEVEILNWPTQPPQEPVKVEESDELPDDHTVTEHITETLVGGAKTWDKFGWPTQLSLTALILGLGWIFRKQLGRLIPKFGNGNGKK